MILSTDNNADLTRLSDDMLISAGTTFDFDLVANVGEKAYSVAKFYEFAMSGSSDFFKITNSKSKLYIEPVIVVGINYVTGSTVKLYANKENGEQIVVKQQFLYQTLEEAKSAINDIYSFYCKNKNGDWLHKKYCGIKYRYALKFPVRPNDMLVKNDVCYLVKGIVVLFYNSIVNICYDSMNNFCENELQNYTKHDYYAIKNKYSIEQL